MSSGSTLVSLCLTTTVCLRLMTFLNSPVLTLISEGFGRYSLRVIHLDALDCKQSTFLKETYQLKSYLKYVLIVSFLSTHNEIINLQVNISLTIDFDFFFT